MARVGGALREGGIAKPAEDIAAEKRRKAEEAEFARKTTPGVKLTTKRKARTARGRPSLLGGGGELSETLG